MLYHKKIIIYIHCLPTLYSSLFEDKSSLIKPPVQEKKERLILSCPFDGQPCIFELGEKILQKDSYEDFLSLCKTHKEIAKYRMEQYPKLTEGTMDECTISEVIEENKALASLSPEQVNELKVKCPQCKHEYNREAYLPLRRFSCVHFEEDYRCKACLIEYIMKEYRSQKSIVLVLKCPLCPKPSLSIQVGEHLTEDNIRELLYLFDSIPKAIEALPPE